MRLFLAFLVISFALGATPAGRPLMRRPSLVLVWCTVVGSLFYSYRFIK